MRAWAAVAVLLLAACERGPAGAGPAETTADADGDMIECALDDSAEFVRDCAVERVQAEEGLQLVVRHPDGGFRRFDVLTDGHGLAAADGAHPAEITVREGGIEVAVGEDRYRFPATIAAHDGR